MYVRGKVKKQEGIKGEQEKLLNDEREEDVDGMMMVGMACAVAV